MKRVVIDLDAVRFNHLGPVSKPDHLRQIADRFEGNTLPGSNACATAADILDLVAEQLENPSPLIVLDLDPMVEPAVIVKHLRRCSEHDGFCATTIIADQIEAQTKPARIPEPGWDGKVLAHTERNHVRREFVRYGVRPIPTHFNWNDSLGNGAQQWGDLIDPELIREGVTP